jgi:hypothetical protein
VVRDQEVEDTITHLFWMRTAGGNMPLALGKAWCEEQGWRLPTLEELKALVRPVRVWETLSGKAAIDRTAFPNTPPVLFWALPESGTLPTAAHHKAYVVDFSNGSENSLVMPGEGYRIRCVR